MGTFQGKLYASVTEVGAIVLSLMSLSPLCMSVQHDSASELKKSLRVLSSQPSENAMPLLGFPSSICKANVAVVAKLLLQIVEGTKGEEFFILAWE